MRRLSRSLARAFPVALYLLALLAPTVFLAAVWLATSDDLDEIDARAEPILVRPTERDITGEQPAVASLAWEEGAALLAPSWQGTVTAIHVAPGDAIAHGDRVVAVDGVDRVAVHTPAPFHRPLASGQVAPDVAMLHGLLVDLGYMDGVPADSEVFNWLTGAAVRDWQTDLGVDDPTLDFDPSHVIWLPEADLTLGELDLTIAAPAPQPGSSFAVAAPSLVRAELYPATANTALDLPVDDQYVAVQDGKQFRVDTEGPAIAADDLGTLAASVQPNEEEVDLELAPGVHRIRVGRAAHERCQQRCWRSLRVDIRRGWVHRAACRGHRIPGRFHLDRQRPRGRHRRPRQPRRESKGSTTPMAKAFRPS